MARVERDHLAGKTNVSIAAKLGVDEGTIRLDLKRLQEVWMENLKRDQEELRAAKLAELADIARRGIEAAEWDAACERAVLFNEPLIDDDGRPLRVYHDDKGAASFRGQKAQSLATARQAIMDQAKLLGIVVDKIAPTKPDGRALTLADLLGMAATGNDDGDGDGDGERDNA